MEIQYTSNTPLLIYYEYCRKIPDGCVFGKREKPFPSKMLEAPIFSLSLGEITKADIESYLKTALNRGLTVWTIKNYLCYFNHIFRKAVKDGLIEKNPCASIRYATFPPIGHKLLSPSVLCAVLKCLQYRPDGNLYSLIRYTGIFREEAILLRWSDVDFDKKQLHIRKPKKGEISAEFEIYSRSRIIRGKERIIPLSQEAIDVLEDERAAQEKRLSTFSRFSSHELSSSKDLNVFTDNYGNCYNPLDFMHINQWIHEKTGIIDFSSDRLRIQFSLELLQSGVDLKTMSQISGFSAYKTAFNYYLSNERIEAMKRRGGRMMGDVLTIYGKEIPISLHKTGKYQYWRATIYTGKKRPDEYQGKTKEILEEKLKKVLPTTRPLIDPEAERINFADWIYKWYDMRKGTLSPSTQLSYYKIIVSMKKFYERFSVGGITHEDAQKLVDELFKSGMGWRSVMQSISIARQASGFAVLKGYIRYNPFDGLKMPAHSRAERLPLSHWELEEFLSAIQLSVRCNALAVMVLAGLRIGECRGLCWEDVNFQEKSLTIRRQRQVGIDDEGHSYEFLQNKTKNGRDQTIYPPQEVFKFLENERIKQNYYKKLSSGSWPGGPDYVFTTNKGKYLDERAIYKALDIIALQINRPDITAHYLRHTAGTMMYELSNDLRATQDFLRHSHIQTTLCYVHTSMERKERAMRKYDEFIKGKRSNVSSELFEL